MPTRTGTAAQINGSGGSSSTSVTVPADCDLVVAFWSHWDGNVSSTMSGLTLNSASFTIQSQLAEGAVTDEAGVGVATLANPSTGSQTFAWTWSGGGARSEGGEIVLVFVKDAGAVRAAATDAQISTNNCSVTLATETTDLLLAFAQSFDNGSPSSNPTLDGTVFIDNALINLNRFDVSQVTPSATSTTVNMGGERYSSMAAVSIQEAAGGGQTGNLGSASETDVAGAFNKAKSKALGGTTAAEVAQAIARQKTLALAGVSEVDVARALTRQKSRLLEALVEIESVSPFGKAKVKALSGASEVETAGTLRPMKSRGVGQALELYTVEGFGGAKHQVLVQAVEIEVAGWMSAPAGESKWLIDVNTGQLYRKVGKNLLIPL